MEALLTPSTPKPSASPMMTTSPTSPMMATYMCTSPQDSGFWTIILVLLFSLFIILLLGYIYYISNNTTNNQKIPHNRVDDLLSDDVFLSDQDEEDKNTII